MTDPQEETRIEDVLTSVRALEQAKVETIGDVLDVLGAASFMPLLLVIALIVVTPVSGIPGLSAVSGLLIVMISAQLLSGRRSLWLPGWMLRIRVPAHRVQGALHKLDDPLRRLQGMTRHRLSFLASGPMARVLLVLCLVCGAMMPFMEVIPTLSSLMAGVVALLTISLLSRDGLFALAGLGAFCIFALALFSILEHFVSTS